MYINVFTGIDSIMTAEEKSKLYTAIGYSGSSHNLALPKHVSGKYTSATLERTVAFAVVLLILTSEIL